jgi:thiamine-phosphate diphosphorylase
MRALGDRGAVHVRARALSAARVYEITVALLPAQERTGCWVVVNDRLDIALAAVARGAQLTSRSITVADARRIMGDGPLGASVHAVDEAIAAERAGADWVVAGHVFATPSKGMTPGRGVELVRAIAAAVRTPCIAAISGIWDAGDAERAATDYLSAYEPRHGP